MTVKVKICGMTNPQDAALAAELGADFVGLNFYPPSPRFVDLERAEKIRDAVGGRSLLVGVFVNAAREFITERLLRVKLDLVQFHGDEDEQALYGWPVPVIKALRVPAGAQPPPAVLNVPGFLMLDAFDPGLYGGTGRRVSVASLRRFDLSRVFVSGGLTPDNVAEVAALGPYAVDVASGIEAAPGITDHRKLRSFIVNAKGSG